MVFEDPGTMTDEVVHFKHVARQLPDGKWTSKLGALEDIEHSELEALSGDAYGTVVAFMKRPVGHPLAGKLPAP